MKRLVYVVIAILAATVLSAPAQTSAAGCTLPVPASMSEWRYRSPESAFKTSGVNLYGDSITYQSWRGLTGFARIAVEAWWGQRTTELVNIAIADSKVHMPKVIVLAAGSNDIRRPETVRYQIIRLRKAIPSTTRIIWVDIANTNERVLAQLVNVTVGEIPGVQRVRWALYVESKYDVWSNAPTVLNDGLHLTCAGSTARNALIRSAIRG